jgi:hypothetical protein
MKTWPSVALIAANILFTASSFADEVELRPLADESAAQAAHTLPTTEKAFVDAINKFDKTTIVEQLGEPATADDVRLKGTNKVVASIWHYHFINTNEDGTYYQTTELDFVDDKVVQVVFLNNDGADNSEGEKYDIPQGLPQEFDTQAAPNKEPGDGVPMIDLDKQ